MRINSSSQKAISIAHGRFTTWKARGLDRRRHCPVQDGLLKEHWDVLQDEATEAESVSGLPMFGDRFPS